MCKDLGARFCCKTARKSKLENQACHSCSSEGNEGQVSQAPGVPPGSEGSQQGTAAALHSAAAVSLCLHLKAASQPSSYTPATSSLFVVCALQRLHPREPPHLPIAAGKEFPTSRAGKAPLQHFSCNHLQIHNFTAFPKHC